MEIIRTSNAGVLITVDGVRVLFDGVCNDFLVYQGTPSSIREQLTENPPDIVAFTHMHEDHYDKAFSDDFEKTTLRTVLCPESQLLIKEKNVTVKGIYTRHIGNDKISHASFILEAEKCVWFMGDASPSELGKFEGERKPDIIIVPYAYANTPSSWKRTLGTGAEKVIILHLPLPENDLYEIRSTVINVVNNDLRAQILNIGEAYRFTTFAPKLG